jgi:hypothetical protein
MGLGCRVMSCHCWSVTGEESPISEDAGCCPPHTKMARELTALRAVVSSAVELVLGRLPNDISQVKVMNELVAKF